MIYLPCQHRGGSATSSRRPAAGPTGEMRAAIDAFAALIGDEPFVGLILDDQARLVYCNQFLLRLSDRTEGQVVGESWFENFLPQPHDELRRVFEGVLADDRSVDLYENPILTRSGNQRLVRWFNCVLRSTSGDAIGLAAVGEYVDARERFERVGPASTDDRDPHARLLAAVRDVFGRSGLRVPGATDRFDVDARVRTPADRHAASLTLGGLFAVAGASASTSESTIHLTGTCSRTDVAVAGKDARGMTVTFTAHWVASIDDADGDLRDDPHASKPGGHPLN